MANQKCIGLWQNYRPDMTAAGCVLDRCSNDCGEDEIVLRGLVSLSGFWRRREAYHC